MSANSHWLQSDKRTSLLLIQQTKLAISVRLPHVVKQFLNDDFSVRIQNRYRYRCPKLSAWLSSNIFCTTIIQQNISILSRECKCYLLRHLCIKCFKTSNSQSASLKSLTVQLSANKVFVEFFFCQLFTIRFETFLSYIASFWRDSGGKLSFVSIFHSLSMYIFLDISVAYSFLDETVQFSYVSNFATTKSADLFFFLTSTFGFHPLLHRLADVLH